MKFYLCQTPDGPQYVHLQADAKKIDPSYDTVELDFSKEPMMNRLNDLMRRAHANETQPSGWSGEEEAAVSPPPPPKPKYQPAMPPRASRSEAQTEWEQFIFDIPEDESYRLDALQQVIDARRDEIGKESA